VDPFKFAQRELNKLAFQLDAFMLVVLLASMVAFALLWPREAKAGYERVQITSTTMTSLLVCQKAPPGAGNSASQSAYLYNYASGGPPSASDVGSLAAAAAGVVAVSSAGYYIFKGTKAVAAVNLLSSSWADQKPAQEVPLVDRSSCYEKPVAEVKFRRERDGLQGVVLMNQYPASKSTLINFCPGPQGQSDRPC
jgi:hypothetical protein